MIAVGGALGAVSRFAVTEIMQYFFGAGFPWGTLTVNLVGAFAIGVLFHLIPDQHIPVGIKYMLTIGFLGAFTTFSTFSMETFEFWSAGERLAAVIYVLASNVGGLSLAWAGYKLGHYLFRSNVPFDISPF